MKKLAILAVAATALISCGNTYTAKTIELTNMNDSLNYAVGLVNGANVKMSQLRNDSSDQAIAEFMDAMQRGYDGKVEELSDVASIGQNVGIATKACETKGLAENPAWTLNEKVFFQGLVNGIYDEQSVMSLDVAKEYFQAAYMASRTENTTAGKAVKGTCPKSTKAIKLVSKIDSINYAFGLLNGSEVKAYVLANDSTGDMAKEFIANVNKGLKKNYVNPQLVTMGEQIGKAIKEQESIGLIGEPSIPTDFELIKQGFINGLNEYNEMWEPYLAGAYIQNTISTIQYGENKAKGEQFLAENKLKQGVKVTESGLQYEVLKMGKGPKPTAESTVKVHYEGKLIDGTVFDSSIERGEPIEFPLSGVIKGWTEGLQLMPVGSKFRLYIPQELGYGAQTAGSIPPYSTLIFEVELLGIQK